MSLQKNCIKPEMTDAEIIRAVYPRGTMKQVARAMHAPLDTARAWLYRSLSPTRRRELARALLAEFDRQETERPLVRAAIVEMAGGAVERSEVDRASAGLGDEPADEAVEPATAAEARPPASGVG